jgi:hypothetical protein
MNPRPIIIRIPYATSKGKKVVKVRSIIKGMKKLKLMTTL